MERQIGALLLDVYARLYERYGPQHWWPAETPFEVIAGAILTQSAAWVNVEKALANLKQANALSAKAFRELPPDELAGLVRPSGYYNAKARKLNSFARWLGELYNDDLDLMFAAPLEHLRNELLGIHGIGEETADSILLYAGNKPVFVIDAYTRRIVSRLGLPPEGASYSAYQRLFTGDLPADARLFNEYHALLVRLGKETCRPRPRCPDCCLGAMCKAGSRNEKQAATFRREIINLV